MLRRLPLRMSEANQSCSAGPDELPPGRPSAELPGEPWEAVPVEAPPAGNVTLTRLVIGGEQRPPPAPPRDVTSRGSSHAPPPRRAARTPAARPWWDVSSLSQESSGLDLPAR